MTYSNNTTMSLHIRIKNQDNNATSEVLTVVLIKIQVFWDVTPCGLVNNRSYRRFEHAYRLPLQGQAVQNVTLKSKAERSFETSVTIYQSQYRNIAENMNVEH